MFVLQIIGLSNCIFQVYTHSVNFKHCEIIWVLHLNSALKNCSFWKMMYLWFLSLKPVSNVCQERCCKMI